MCLNFNWVCLGTSKFSFFFLPVLMIIYSWLCSNSNWVIWQQVNFQFFFLVWWWLNNGFVRNRLICNFWWWLINGFVKNFKWVCWKTSEFVGVVLINDVIWLWQEQHWTKELHVYWCCWLWLLLTSFISFWKLGQQNSIAGLIHLLNMLSF